MQKPRVLILGGCGFIGRNLTSFLISRNLVSFVRVVDKVPPQIAWLNKNHQKYMYDSTVEFKSANLINPDSCKNAFASDCPWDFVVNCAGETKTSQTDAIYDEGIRKLSLNCARQSALSNVKHYVELSSGTMYSSERIAHKEDGPIEPWTLIGKYKSEVERELENVPNLNYTILRLPVVYGSGDRGSLTQRLLVAAIYKKMGETMKLLWSSGLKLNTVHVDDVCRAVWFVLNRDDTIKQTYNVVDSAGSTQGSICDLLADLYGIKIDYYGNVFSNFVELSNAADEANDKHLGPWAVACRADAVNTPLSPYMDAELLINKHQHLDGAKLRGLGFRFEVPKPTVEILKGIVDEFVDMKVYPVSLAP